MSERATPALDALFEFLREFIRVYGFAPTVKQMCAHTGRKPSAVRHLLWQLHRDGWITLGQGGWSQIDVIYEGGECLRCGRPFR